MPEDDRFLACGKSFPETRWSLVVSKSDSREGALEELCQIYWRPIYSFIRSKGIRRTDAEDLTQSFFVRMIKKDDLFKADQAKGKLRSYLLGALTRHLSDQKRYQGAAKRGNHLEHLPLAVSEFDFKDAELRFSAHPVDQDTPDRIFDRSWALNLLTRTHKRIQRDYQQAGKIKEYELLKPAIATTAEIDSSKTARELDISPGTVRVLAHRLRKNFRAALKEEVTETVATYQAVDDEMAYLMEVFSR